MVSYDDRRAKGGNTAHPAGQLQVNAGAAEVCGGILGDGAVKGAEDVVVAVYLLNRDMAPVYPRKVTQHVLQDLHQDHPPQPHACSRDTLLFPCTALYIWFDVIFIR